MAVEKVIHKQRIKKNNPIQLNKNTVVFPKKEQKELCKKEETAKKL